MDVSYTCISKAMLLSIRSSSFKDHFVFLILAQNGLCLDTP